jgi:CBS domain-containing protein
MNTLVTRTPPRRRLAALRVVDVAHPGVISCPRDTPLRTVAHMMATHRVHALVVNDRSAGVHGHGICGVISDVDLLAAAESADFDSMTAEDLAGSPALTVTAREPLGRAVELMLEHDASHVVMVDPGSGRPIGVVSSLDVARALAR